MSASIERTSIERTSIEREVVGGCESSGESSRIKTSEYQQWIRKKTTHGTKTPHRIQ